MNEREKILEFTISEFECYKIALTKYGSSEEVTKNVPYVMGNACKVMQRVRHTMA